MRDTDITAATISALLFVGTGGMAFTATAADEPRDPAAEALVKKMSDYMGGLKSFSADAAVVDEMIMGDGLKLTALRSGSFKIRRPDHFYMSRKGMVRDQEVYYDGKHLRVHAKTAGAVLDLPAEGDVDMVLNKAVEVFGAELPARDLLSADSYTPLMEAVEESAALGLVDIDGRTCRHLVFRTDEVDWQLWVEEGDRPLPCRYTITSKWTYAAPQYSVTFSNWAMDPELTDDVFSFTIPEGMQPVTAEELRNKIEEEAAK
jgi:hypothetical protein